MTTNWTRRSVIGALAVVALLIVAVPIVKLATSSPDVLEACVNPGNGNMRLVDSSTACHNNESRVSWNVTGPAGPPGPMGGPGPAGPPGPSSGGAPFVWVCTPVNFPNSGTTSPSDVYIFNGSGASANTTVKIYDKSGTDLTGHNVPGSSPATAYPGDASAVAVSPNETRDFKFVAPQMAGGSGIDGVTDSAFSVKVTSDQPIVVGINVQFNPYVPNVCSLLPK